MHDNCKDGFKKRFKGLTTKKKKSGHLDGFSIFQEMHCNGHKQLNSKALWLGNNVGFDIYRMHN